MRGQKWKIADQSKVETKNPSPSTHRVAKTMIKATLQPSAETATAYNRRHGQLLIWLNICQGKNRSITKKMG
ncbi:uncharacterized protein Dvar_71890 [Desulfosarcina variabilis str. Montpellier]